MTNTVGQKYSAFSDNKDHSLYVKGKECLYAKYDYISQLKTGHIVSYYLIDNLNTEIVGSLRIKISNDLGYTAEKAPFSSLNIQSQIESNTIEYFLGFIVNDLLNQGVSQLTIKHFPEIYDKAQYDNIIRVLNNTGFTVQNTEINHHIPIGNNRFDALIHPMEKRKISKAIKAGLSFKKHDNNDLKYLFSILNGFRKQKNIPVNVSGSNIENAFKNFPENYQLWSVSSDERIVALTITVDPVDKIRYNFLPASDGEFNKLSPMVFLISKLYEHSRKAGKKYLDLGISSINGKPQDDLIRFKERIGGISSLKHTFHKVMQ